MPYIGTQLTDSLNFKEIHNSGIFKTLRKETCLALPGFHTFTGCDTNSQFQDKGKSQYGLHGNHFPEVTDALIAMTAMSFSTA